MGTFAGRAWNYAFTTLVAVLLFGILSRSVFAVQVTIQENPAQAANDWGACFNYVNSSGQICAGNGQSSASVDVPYGTVVNYLCTSDWSGGPAYAWGSWAGSIDSSNPCINDLNLTVNGPLTLIANYASTGTVSTQAVSTSSSTTTTIQYEQVSISENQSSPSNTWGACFNYSGSPSQVCIRNTGTASVEVPYGTVINYLCTANWGSNPAFNWAGWSGATSSTSPCLQGPFLTVTGPVSFVADYYGTASSSTSTTSTASSTVSSTSTTVLSDIKTESDGSNSAQQSVAPLGSIPLNSYVVNPGQSTVLTASASGGTPPYQYQWYEAPAVAGFETANCSYNAYTMISGATFSSYTASPSSNTVYCVIITDNSGSTYQEASWISVDSPSAMPVYQASQGWQGAGYYGFDTPYLYPAPVAYEDSNGISHVYPAPGGLTDYTVFIGSLSQFNSEIQIVPFAGGSYADYPYYSSLYGWQGANKPYTMQPIYSSGEVVTYQISSAQEFYTIFTQPGTSFNPTTGAFASTPESASNGYQFPAYYSFALPSGGTDTLLIYSQSMFDQTLSSLGDAPISTGSASTTSTSIKTESDGPNSAPQSVAPLGSTPLNSYAVTPGQSTILTASASGGTPPYQYQWYEAPAVAGFESANCSYDAYTPISGATLSSYTASPMSDTVYCVIITDNSGSSYDEASWISVNPPVSSTFNVGNGWQGPGVYALSDTTYVYPSPPDWVDANNVIHLHPIPGGTTTYSVYISSLDQFNNEFQITSPASAPTWSQASYYTPLLGWQGPGEYEVQPVPLPGFDVVLYYISSAQEFYTIFTQPDTSFNSITGVFTSTPESASNGYQFPAYYNFALPSGSTDTLLIYSQSMFDQTMSALGDTPTTTSTTTSNPLFHTEASTATQQASQPSLSAPTPASVTPAGPLTVNISESMASVAPGQSVTLTASATGGTPPYNYQWFSTPDLQVDSSYCNNDAYTAIPGATGSTYTATPNASMLYCVSVSDVNADVYDVAAYVGFGSSQPSQSTQQAAPQSVSVQTTPDAPASSAPSSQQAVTLQQPAASQSISTFSAPAPDSTQPGVTPTYAAAPAPDSASGTPATVDQVINGVVQAVVTYISSITQ